MEKHVLFQVRMALDDVVNVESQNELQPKYGALRKELGELTMKMGPRIADLKDPRERDDLQAARALLKTNSPMLYSATKVGYVIS